MLRLFALLPGCSSGPDLPPPQVEVGALVGTVALATWDGVGGAATRVVVEGPEGDFLASDWQEAGPQQHSVTLLGLRADQRWLAFVEDDTGLRSEGVAFSTDPLPDGVPAIHLTGEPGWQGYVLTSVIGGSAAAMLMDETGAVVWWMPSETRGRVPRVRPRHDQRGIWLAGAQGWPEEGGQFLSLDWQGEVLEGWEEYDFSHDFVEWSDGRLAFLTYDERQVEELGQSAIGGTLVERAPDGTERAVWTTWDTWVPGEDGAVSETGYWTGLNALSLDEEAGTYTVGSRGLNAFVVLDAATGQVLRQIGGPQSDYAFPEPDDAPQNQHQAQWLEDGLLVFDNRVEAEGSRVVELALDEDQATATARWSWQPEPSLYVYAMGDVHRAGDGSTLVTWSTAGRIDDLGPQGELRCSYEMNLGHAFGFSQVLEALPGTVRLSAQ